MARWKGRQNERILVVGRPALSAVWPKYIFTAGVYGFWHKRNLAVLTNQRVVLGKGLFSRRETSVPISRIDGAAYFRKGLAGYCEVDSSHGEWGHRHTRIGPLRPRTARRFASELDART